MLKAFRFRIYPTKKQKILMAKTFGCCRFVYNCFLDRKISFYETEHKTLSYGSCSKELTGLKLLKTWLNEVDSIALQQSLRDLDSAYDNFFSGSGFPRFKSKHSNRHSYRTQMVNSNIKVEGNRIQLPKLAPVETVGCELDEAGILRLFALLPQALLGRQNGQQRAKRAGVPERDVRRWECSIRPDLVLLI
ncbi:MAG TPA: helix-turn-helix domain-containing protein [Anaerovoracaceae bacterium]|nr:helix-turn-helix domain-containing protein [Anaerovoracaceae bacterium]